MEIAATYRTTLLAEMPDGQVFLEVHRDIYKRGIDPLNELRKLVSDYRLEDRIDWQRIPRRGKTPGWVGNRRYPEALTMQMRRQTLRFGALLHD